MRIKFGFDYYASYGLAVLLFIWWAQDTAGALQFIHHHYTQAYGFEPGSSRIPALVSGSLARSYTNGHAIQTLLWCVLCLWNFFRYGKRRFLACTLFAIPLIAASTDNQVTIRPLHTDIGSDKPRDYRTASTLNSNIHGEGSARGILRYRGKLFDSAPLPPLRRYEREAMRPLLTSLVPLIEREEAIHSELRDTTHPFAIDTGSLLREGWQFELWTYTGGPLAGRNIYIEAVDLNGRRRDVYWIEKPPSTNWQFRLGGVSRGFALWLFSHTVLEAFRAKFWWTIIFCSWCPFLLAARRLAVCIAYARTVCEDCTTSPILADVTILFILGCRDGTEFIDDVTDLDVHRARLISPDQARREYTRAILKDVPLLVRHQVEAHLYRWRVFRQWVLRR
jgi:hypothetical protein